MSNIVLFSNYSDKNDANKDIRPLETGYPFNVIPCQLVLPTSLTKPVIELSTPIDFSRINYLWLSDYRKYYFIESYTLKANGMYEVQCRIDALYTLREYLKSIYALVTRQEYVYSGLIPDSQIMSRIDRDIQQVNIGNVGGNATGYHITLTTTGGTE